MGNYYGKYRRFGSRRNSRKKNIAFFGGGALVLLFAVMQFTAVGDGVKDAFAGAGHTVASAFESGVDWGKEKFGGEGNGNFSVPVSSGVVVEEFGVIADAEGKEAYHNGIDIQVPAGSEVLAAADGKVADIAQHEDGTYWLTLDHEKSWSTVYGRLGEVSVNVDDTVTKGAVLGKPAKEILHFEVLEDKIEKDPVKYFKTDDDL